MTFTVENLEFYLLVLMRVSGLVMTAPFFGYNAVPMRVRAALSVFITLVVIQTVPVIELSYTGLLGYSIVFILLIWQDN